MTVRRGDEGDELKRGLIGKAIDAARSIGEGMVNLSNDFRPDFYEGRKSACLGCSELLVHERHMDGSVGRYQCKVCGCLMEAKWRSSGSTCPLGKWVS